jgi:hypothetical protein
MPTALFPFLAAVRRRAHSCGQRFATPTKFHCSSSTTSTRAAHALGELVTSTSKPVPAVIRAVIDYSAAADAAAGSDGGT